MASMKSEAVDITIAAVGSKTTYIGAGVTGLGWFLSNEFFGLVGVLIGVIGLTVNIYFKHHANRRAKIEHEARMARLLRGQHTDTDIGSLELDE